MLKAVRHSGICLCQDVSACLYTGTLRQDPFFAQDPIALHPHFTPMLPKKQDGTAGCLWLSEDCGCRNSWREINLFFATVRHEPIREVPMGPLCSGKANKLGPVNPCSHLPPAGKVQGAAGKRSKPCSPGTVAHLPPSVPNDFRGPQSFAQVIVL